MDERDVLEGLARELVRRIQYMRKEAGMNIEDHVKVYVKTDDEEILKALREFEDYVKSETRAVEVVIGEARGHVREWEIDGQKVVIGVEKAG
jgi:isoleucyl-tRNA synthetase